MNLLLDTHIWLWGLLDPDRLIDAVAAELENPDNQRWLSPISVWEALLLAERGRVDLGEDAASWIDHQLRRVPMRDAPLTRQVAVASRALDLDQDDPADRFLAASAVVHDLVLVTADRRLWRSTQYEVLRNP